MNKEMKEVIKIDSDDLSVSLITNRFGDEYEINGWLRYNGLSKEYEFDFDTSADDTYMVHWEKIDEIILDFYNDVFAKNEKAEVKAESGPYTIDLVVTDLENIREFCETNRIQYERVSEEQHWGADYVFRADNKEVLLRLKKEYW